MWEEEQICPSCCRNSRYGLRHQYCRGDLEGLTCLWAYEGITRKLISQSKYRFYFDYLRQFTISKFQFTNNLQFGQFSNFLNTKPVVVPVPLHARRERERGFNQAGIISKLVARGWGLGTSDLLVRVKDTEQQVGKKREDRLGAMIGAFELKRNTSYVTPDTVVLVDDVWTTGATLRECAKVLKKAGAERVWGLVLAR